jgi:radical SAM protein with 4Fe4S-binding SPASM domain
LASNSHTTVQSLSDFIDRKLHSSSKNERPLTSIELEITARCNNRCRHCYINLPASDKHAASCELSLEEIKTIADESADLGALWCLITGGEPLLRKDFVDIYLHLKRKGFLVSIFTNGTLVSQEHVALFKRYPPRDLEISVYGVSQHIYEQVTCVPGSYRAFRRGLDYLLKSWINVSLKATLTRSNLEEFSEIAEFCRQKSHGQFRFDPFLHLRVDGSPMRNQEIKSERLLPSEIVALEKSDRDRFKALTKSCSLIQTAIPTSGMVDKIICCAAGLNSVYVRHDGALQFCSALRYPEFVYDLRQGSLSEAWHNFIPDLRREKYKDRDLSPVCTGCHLINLCMWCPAHAHLETGELGGPVTSFCKIAHTRGAALGLDPYIKQ